jgi:thioredoxin 1
MALASSRRAQGLLHTLNPRLFFYSRHFSAELNPLKELSSEEEYRKILSDSKPAILQFTAAWCGPCRQIKPILEQMAQSNPTVKVFKVNIDLPEVLPIVADNNVTAVPTFVGIKHGSKTSFTGADKNQLVEMFSLLSN